MMQDRFKPERKTNIYGNWRAECCPGGIEKGIHLENLASDGSWLVVECIACCW